MSIPYAVLLYILVCVLLLQLAAYVERRYERTKRKRPIKTGPI